MTPMSKEFLKAWHFHEEKATFPTAEFYLAMRTEKLFALERKMHR